jgi:hypothetical protein
LAIIEAEDPARARRFGKSAASSGKDRHGDRQESEKPMLPI